jgi:hypothetical protein
MTDRTEAEKQAVFDDCMQASEEFHQFVHGDTIEAGRRGNTDYLRRTLRADLTADARSSMRTVMALETLNAYEEGMRREHNGL